MFFIYRSLYPSTTTTTTTTTTTNNNNNNNNNNLYVRKTNKMHISSH